ncbi:DUF5809 family protein [Halobaculum lipolyticum]|uniref:DUF5809 family protein n=1 Tax=Halobaculum lipolyticum TaxID=3032001 RepID=A0ABD5WDY1_9EURY|nr:DUF5809 family protein [Halobaculum sp. DT31]
MDTEGTLAPATAAEARAEYDELVPAAKVAVREATKAMEFDRAEYDERVTGDVIETVRDALFASLLRVHVGTRAEFEAWLDDHPDYESDVAGSDNVDNVVWHPVAFAVDDPAVDGGDATHLAVAATWQAEREAALGTLRRRAFGRVYRGVVSDSDGEGDDDAAGDAAAASGGPDASDAPDEP